MHIQDLKNNIHSNFYIENILLKQLCKPKDRVAAADENNIIY